MSDDPDCLDRPAADPGSDPDSRSGSGPGADGAGSDDGSANDPVEPAVYDGVRVRPARLDDRPAVVAFTEDTWSDRESGDYLPRVFEEWIRTDGSRQRTLVAELPAGGSPDAGDAGRDDRSVVGVVQGVLLSEYEAWGQGIRVDPAHRGEGVSRALTRRLFDWAADRGATVVRNMVFSWNAAGLGQSRATGYRPATTFRWVHPRPAEDPDLGPASAPDVVDLRAVADPTTAWSCWQSSDARDHLAGLGLTDRESWALAEVTREDLRRLADEQSVIAVRSPDGLRGATYRVRVYDRDGEDGTETWAEYGAAAWTDLAGARALLEAIAADARAAGADRTRVLVPETPRAVTDAAYLQVEAADEPDFVMAADLTADHPRGPE